MSLGSRSRVRTGRLSHWTETEVLQFARQIPNPLTGCSAWLSILLTHPSYPCALQASYCNRRFLGTSGASELSPGHEHLHSRTGRARRSPCGRLLESGHSVPPPRDDLPRASTNFRTSTKPALPPGKVARFAHPSVETSRAPPCLKPIPLR